MEKQKRFAFKKVVGPEMLLRKVVLEKIYQFQFSKNTQKASPFFPFLQLSFYGSPLKL